MPTTIDSAGITFNDATSLTSANIGTAQLVNGSVTAAKLGTTEQKQIAKAWVNFNGTTSPGTIRAQYNVSSITKNGTGDYTVNFATPMSDTNYLMLHGGTVGGNAMARTIGLQTISNCLLAVRNSSSGVLTDDTAIHVAFFGN